MTDTQVTITYSLEKNGAEVTESKTISDDQIVEIEYVIDSITVEFYIDSDESDVTQELYCNSIQFHN